MPAPVTLIRQYARSPVARAAALMTVGTLGVALVVLVVAAWYSELFGIRHHGVLAAAPERVVVESLAALHDTVFFDPVTGAPVVWYTITPQGETELFRGAGRHPETGDALKPVTPAIVQLVERRLRNLEQQRAEQQARRSATARADAEIARARKRRDADASGPARLAAETAPPSLPQAPPVRASVRSLPMVADASASGAARVAPPPVPRVDPDVSTNPSRAATAPTGRDDGITIERRAEPDRVRAHQYDELIRAARASIDAGRYEAGRSQAQRAIQVDPRRMAARSLWAEAQTRIDAWDQPVRSRMPPRF